MIPKVLYLYWGGKLSWLRFLTVYSFKKQNPDWKIVVYKPMALSNEVTWSTKEQSDAYQGEDWFPELEKYAEIRYFDCKEVGFSNDIPEVHKSGLFRSWILSQNGGLYSDFDILYFKPIKIPDHINVIQCYNPEGEYFSDGLLGCSKNHPQYEMLFQETKKHANPNYQGYGLNVWNTKMPRENFADDVWNIPMSYVYEYDSLHIQDMFSDKRPMFDVMAIGCHWYGGSILTKSWERKLSPNCPDYKIMINKIIKEIDYASE